MTTYRHECVIPILSRDYDYDTPQTCDKHIFRTLCGKILERLTEEELKKLSSTVPDAAYKSVCTRRVHTIRWSDLIQIFRFFKFDPSAACKNSYPIPDIDGDRRALLRARKHILYLVEITIDTVIFTRYFNTES